MRLFFLLEGIGKMDMYERTINDTVLSGVAPVRLTYQGVFDGYGECPVAYLAHTALFTTATGVIDDPMTPTKDDELGVLVTLRAVAHAMRTVEAMLDKERTTRWIAVEASEQLLLCANTFDLLSEVIEREHCRDPKRICLAFSPDVMGLDRAAVQQGLKDIRAAGLTVAITGIDKSFALSELMDLAVDYVVLDRSLSDLSTDRNRVGVLAALIALLHTMDVQCVAYGVVNDDQIRELGAVECFGFVPSEEYRGEFMLPIGYRDKEAVLGDEEGV